MNIQSPASTASNKEYFKDSYISLSSKVIQDPFREFVLKLLSKSLTKCSFSGYFTESFKSRYLCIWCARMREGINLAT